MKRLDKITKITNVILAVLYVPLSFYAFLCQMASEGTMGVENQLYINLITIFCIVCFFIPLLCVLGIVLSVILRHKGRSITAFIVQFLPLIVFILTMLLLFFAEGLLL